MQTKESQKQILQDVKMDTQTSFIANGDITIYPRKYPLSLMKRLFKEESAEMLAFLKTRKEDTLWKD